MALYDVREKKRVSENFYFDTNSDQMKALLRSQIPYQDTSTLCTTAVFNITHVTNDLCIIVRVCGHVNSLLCILDIITFHCLQIDKVLQATEISDAVDVYAKDEKVYHEIK
jgi:hypothetical protein